jgi:hypothetical protein
MKYAAQSFLAMLMFLATIVHGSTVQAQTARECAYAFERSQIMERDGKLLAAQRLASKCARDACPDVIRVECIGRHRALAKSMPSLVIVARDASGKDVVDAKLLIDGVEVRARLDGKAIEVDPGAHELRVEAAKREPVEQTVLVAQGEKQRMIVITVSGAGPLSPRASTMADTASSPAGDASEEAGGGMSPLVWGGFGVAGVGVIVGAVTAGVAFAGASTCEKDGCTQDELDGKLTVAHVSTVSFVLAGAGATAGLIGLFTARSSDGDADVALVASPAFSGIVGRW